MLREEDLRQRLPPDGVLAERYHVEITSQSREIQTAHHTAEILITENDSTALIHESDVPRRSAVLYQ